MELEISRTAKLTNQIGPPIYFNLLDQHVPYVCLTHLKTKCHRRLSENLMAHAGMRYLRAWSRNGRAHHDELQAHKFDGQGRLARGAAQQKSGAKETDSASASDALVGKSFADISGSSRHRLRVM